MAQTPAQTHSQRAWYLRNRASVIAKAKARAAADPVGRAAKMRAWYLKNRERILAKQKAHGSKPSSFYRYGLSPAGYEAMLAEHGYTCAICSRPHTDTHRLHVDHDHVTGAIRGLLCRHCNWVLGLVHDDADLLRSAIAYLSRGAI